MFSNVGEYEPCGIFTIGHFAIMAITIIGIIIALRISKNKSKKQIHKLIKIITITAWVLEIWKIVFNIKQNSISAVNTYLPLYYCSILLYAGLLSSFAKGKLQRIGDVSLATGAIIGGIVFMIYPSTSLPIYPVFHALSIHSFLFHGTMVYLGILINKTKYVELKREDIKYFASLIGAMSIVAFIVNKFFNGNLMFISNNFPGTPLEIIYNITGGGIIFTILMVALQMTLPFYICYYTIKLLQYLKNNKKTEILMLTAILIIQTVVFVVAGINKSYIHMDEAYSLGLASYNKIDIQENENFYNTWHSKEYYQDYLQVDENEKNDFSPVYENQKNDVHPPLYYLLLRICMSFHIGSYSKWSGIILNIIIYTFITIFVYLISKKLLEKKEKCKEKSALIALISSLTLASISNVIYIRMYTLATFNIVATTYAHLKLLDKKEKNTKLLIVIGILALLGSLTHYYYLFFLAMLVIMFIVKYLKQKEYKQLAKYLGTIILAGIISLIIFPYSIKHMFFGYRGQGVISNLMNISKFILNIAQYLFITNVYAFNNVLFIIVVFLLGIVLYKKIKKIKTVKANNPYIKYIAYPTIFYGVLASVASPFVELRYIMPVCSLIVLLVFYGIITLMQNIIKEKSLNKTIIGICLLMLIMPFVTNQIIDLVIGKNFRKEEETSYSSKVEITEKLKEEINLPVGLISNFTDANIDDTLLFIKNFKLEPEVLYSNKRNITKIVKENENLPALYFFNSSHSRFLDDILLFTYIKDSYIAKDIECTEESIKQIVLGKDASQGILVFINDGQENDNILNNIKNALNLNNTKYLNRLNACDVYLVN